MGTWAIRACGTQISIDWIRTYSKRLRPNMLSILTADTEACGKDFRCDVLRGIPPEENRSGFETGITANVAKARWWAYEEAVSRWGRMHEEGPKNGCWNPRPGNLLRSQIQPGLE